ncbi:MAG: hypothetical protein ACTSYB_00355, partial [Candidatus Helarchaeota archaeon]
SNFYLKTFFHFKAGFHPPAFTVPVRHLLNLLMGRLPPQLIGGKDMIEIEDRLLFFSASAALFSLASWLW